MNNTENQAYPFGKVLLTGVFVGFAATIVCLFFNIFYRNATGYILAEIINVSSLIFGVNILFVLVGLGYFACLRFFKKGDLLFIVLSLLITIFCLWKVGGAQRTDDNEINMQFRNLLYGIITILGICSTIFVPLLFHSKKFEEYVL